MKEKERRNDLVRPGEAFYPGFSINDSGELSNNLPICAHLSKNREILQHTFAKDGTFICRDVSSEKPGNASCFAVYFDGLVRNDIIFDSILRPIIETDIPVKTAEDLAHRVISNVETNIIDTMEDCFNAMFMGDSVIFLDGCTKAVTASTKGFPVRAVQEPEAERSLIGPREGFTESVMMNMAMLHRKLKTVDFNAEPMTFGTRTQTRGFLCYLGSIARPELLKEVKRRLSTVKMDGILDANYLVEQISDHNRSLFRTVGISERPDVIAAGLLEGRIALLLDGTPVAIEIPYIFAETFQAAEDYYQNFWFASFNRILRILCYVLSISVPGIFVSLVSYHQELLPTDLALSISQARVGVPFPIAVECFLMITVFEMLREASQRLPSNISQALSIVGAIVIGDAAVSARFIGSTTLIVVALAGITGLISPKLENSVLILRFVFLIAGALLGLYGILFCFLFVSLYLMNVESFGVPYLAYFFSLKGQDQKDIMIRAPWQTMRKRPEFFAKDSVRKEN